MKKGWEMKTLKEIGETQTGNTPATSDADNYGGFIPFVKPGHFNIDGTINSMESGLSEKGSKSARLIKANSILMVCIGATIGKTGFCEIPVTSNQQINSLTPKSDFEPRYFYYALMSDDFYKKVIHGSSQATLPIINKSKWENLTVSFPRDKNEQQRIVSILDEAFAAIDQAKENVQRNLQNAKELFQSELNCVFSNGGENWIVKKIGEVVEFLNGFAFKSSEAVESSNTQLLRMGNLYQNRLSLSRSPVFYPNDFAITFKRYVLKENDLIISLTGTTGKEDYGFTVRIPKTDSTLLLNQRIAKITIKDENVLNKDLLYHFLISRVFLDELYLTANGTRQANLSTETMKELRFSFPKDKNVQQKIVHQLDTLSAETKKLERLYHQKLNSLEELKKGILQKAFSGGLTEKTVLL